LGLVLAPPASRPVQAVELPSIITVETVALANSDQDGMCDLWEALKASFDQKSNGTPSQTITNAPIATGRP